MTAAAFLIWLLGDLPLFDKTGGNVETDGTFQGVDIADLMAPADMRGTGMQGYWVMEGYSDPQGDMVQEAEDAMILYLGEDGTCVLRHDDRSSIDETAGQWQDDVVILHDENEDMDFELGISLFEGNLYMDIGEEGLLMCFRGPYTEDALLYQCTEYFKAASFMASSLMESTKEMGLSYAQWDYGMTQTVDYWDDLLHTAGALKMAAERYLAADEQAQARAMTTGWTVCWIS